MPEGNKNSDFKLSGRIQESFYTIVEKFNLNENLKVEQLKEDSIVKNWLAGSKQSTRKTGSIAKNFRISM
jgi:hypothetical protein